MIFSETNIAACHSGDGPCDAGVLAPVNYAGLRSCCRRHLRNVLSLRRFDMLDIVLCSANQLAQLVERLSHRGHDAVRDHGLFDAP